MGADVECTCSVLQAALAEQTGLGSVTVTLADASEASALTSSYASILKALALGGRLTVTIHGDVSADADRALETAAMLAGFTDLSVTRAGGTVQLSCRKPAYEQGAASKLGALRPRASAPAAPLAAGVTLVAAPAAGSGEELIDEDSLLTDDVVGAAPAADCSTKRKACKNCSCGRAEQEASVSAPAASSAPSSCGSCGKGDAFRCATCPHLGKPAFKMAAGGAVMLDIGTDDI